MTFFARLAFVAPALLVAVACGGKIDSGNDAGSDGSPPPLLDAQPPPPWDGGPPPLLDGGQCNNVPIVGPTVTFNQVPSAAPPFPSGGSPPFQGVYGLVAFTVYTGPNGGSSPLGTGQVTLQLNSAKDGFDFQSVAVIGNQAPQRGSSIGQITGPNQLTLTAYCPGSSNGTPALYYFDGSTLWLRATTGSNNAQPIDEQYSLMTN